MTANIYRILRSIISDEVSDYTIPDTRLLMYLDKAIDKASEILDYTFKEDIVITTTDISNGYVNLSREIVGIVTQGIGGEGIAWQLGGGKKIRFIDSDAIPTGTIEIRYRARFNKFEGIVKDQSAMDLPTDAELPVIMYAIGLYMEDQGTPTAGDDNYGPIKVKSEDTMRIEYAVGSSGDSFSTPDKAKSTAIEMLKDLPMAQVSFFSVKI